MKIQAFNTKMVLFILLIIVGATLFVVSLTSLLTTPFMIAGVRSVAFFFLFAGIGEYLNHPLQKKLSPPTSEKNSPQQTFVRTRNPCGLGSTLDVLALISLFVALSFFFFPYQQ